MNRKAPQPLQMVQDGKNVSIVQKGLNKPVQQIVIKPAKPSPTSPPKAKS